MQGWVREMVALARELDPTRPVEDNSAGGSVGVFEHLDTDVNSFHHYDDDAASWRALLEAEAAVTFPGSAANYVGGGAQDGAPWWNSEFASFSAFGGSDDVFCGLFGSLNELRRRPRLTGWVLTQLTDVEYEHNGLVTYDRATKEDMCARHGVGLADVIGDDFVGFEWLPGEALTAGATVQVPLWFSQWSSGEARGRTLRLRWGDGETEAVADFESAPYEVESVDGITVTAPNDTGAHVLVAEVFDGDVRVCANRISVLVSG